MRGIGTIVITSNDGTVMFECIKDSALIADKLNDLSSKKVAVEFLALSAILLLLPEN